MPNELNVQADLAADTVVAAEGASRPIKSRTAILVIHGIGEQMPYATLDQFARGFVNYLTPDSSPDQSTTWPYTLTQQATYADNDRGCDFCLRLTHTQASQGYLDLHEYYWAFQTEKQTTLSEIGDWLSDTLTSFRQHYKEDSDLSQAYEKRNASRKVNKLNWLRYGVWVWRLGQVGDALISWLPTGILRWLRSVAEKLFPAKLVTDYVGDVVIYTNTDRKSRFYGIRDTILREAQKKLLTLLHDEGYDQVLVVGHSLGTVIGYDVLNRLDLMCNFNVNKDVKANLGKLKAFVTFGSPLDKVYFFLREQTGEGEYIRRQLLGNLRLFRKLPPKQGKPISTDPSVSTGPPLASLLPNLPDWANFYHDNDDISGHLDFYLDVNNIEAKFADPLDNKWYRAHSGYWTHKPLYQKLLKYVL